MLRLSIYRWVPLAENMLPDIEHSLRQAGVRIVQSSMGPSDSLEFATKVKTSLDTFNVTGKYNRRGFVQHVAELTPVPGVGLGNLLEQLVPQLREFEVEAVYNALPLSVRNKLAVLEEGIRSFQEFESKRFDTTIEIPAKVFLSKSVLTTILIDDEYQEYRQSVRNGLTASELRVSIPKSDRTHLSVVNSTEDFFVFFAESFRAHEQDLLDSAIYQYCSLLNFDRFLNHVIEILKGTRDHIVPLRRDLVMKLQRNTDEHFTWLTRLKKYLTYANIKLPVLEKVRNHLVSAYRSEQFEAKLDAFADAAKITSYPTLSSLPQRLSPLVIRDRLRENYLRLSPLYDEDTNEVKVLSRELYQVLEGSLLSKNAEILERELDASRLALELDRGAKNRANALKVLSIVLSANLGALVATLLNLGVIESLLLIIATPVIAYFLTEAYISRKESYYRLVIPFHVTVPRHAISALTADKNKGKTEINGTRRTYTWSETFRKIESSRRLKRSQRFRISIDHEMRGYVYTATVERESSKIDYDSTSIVIQLANLLDAAGCKVIEPFTRTPVTDSSLLAEILHNLDISLEPSLTALNRILTSDADKLTNELIEFNSDSSFAATLSEEDTEMLRHITTKREDYLAWLLSVKRNPEHEIEKETLHRLLGLDNISRKYDALIRAI